MKTIGRTNKGDYLVEMNPDEHRALAMLARVESGWSEIEVYHDHPEISFVDLSTPIGAIIHYAQSRTRLNELQRLLDDIEDTYTNEQEEYGSTMANETN